MSEIGSEFWEADTTEQDICFFIAGRTALEFIIRDILKDRKVAAVHMPSYCCHTMIEPFIRHRIPIRFYDVYHQNGVLISDVPQVRKDEIYFYIRYFGYKDQIMGHLTEIKKSGCVVIEDTTHSWLLDLSAGRNEMLADYRYTSYRKWTGFTGIASAEKNAKFIIPQEEKRLHEFDFMRTQAQGNKRRYIEDLQGSKAEFLKQFGEADSMLKEDYVDWLPSYKSMKLLACLDANRMKSARYENASTLYKSIVKIPQITTMFPTLQEDDVPLFVPILLPEDIRNDFRRFLISKDIYCPVHWPLSPMHDQISEKAKQLYRRELSLVCDQRYGQADMDRFVQCIEDFFKEYV